jgi:hypothetical protein
LENEGARILKRRRPLDSLCARMPFPKNRVAPLPGKKKHASYRWSNVCAVPTWARTRRGTIRLDTTLSGTRACRVMPRHAGVLASQPRHVTKEAGACRVVLLGTAAQQCPCQPRHDAGAQVQIELRFTKCSNTKIHSFKVTTKKENTK